MSERKMVFNDQRNVGKNIDRITIRIIININVLNILISTKPNSPNLTPPLTKTFQQSSVFK
jgi:hypothetical protein